MIIAFQYEIILQAFYHDVSSFPRKICHLGFHIAYRIFDSSSGGHVLDTFLAVQYAAIECF